uniref:Uncharacterized protein n=1 Tax=Physcomitrium patens TaxID=3218 RepID=A0A2K1LAZ9_PHYPA|nr:hypothetical protein PHYPA_001630 [Physcomitrium patens]
MKGRTNENLISKWPTLSLNAYFAILTSIQLCEQSRRLLGARFHEADSVSLENLKHNETSKFC